MKWPFSWQKHKESSWKSLLCRWTHLSQKKAEKVSKRLQNDQSFFHLDWSLIVLLKAVFLYKGVNLRCCENDINSIKLFYICFVQYIASFISTGYLVAVLQYTYHKVAVVASCCTKATEIETLKALAGWVGLYIFQIYTGWFNSKMWLTLHLRFI